MISPSMHCTFQGLSFPYEIYLDPHKDPIRQDLPSDRLENWCLDREVASLREQESGAPWGSPYS